MRKPSLKLILFIIFISTFYRIIPHAFNFSPIYAIALFTGAKFNNKYLAAITTAIPMLLTDFYYGIYDSMTFNYLGLFAINYIGSFLGNSNNYKNIMLSSITSSLAFYIISNFGVWLSPYYNHDINGLINCYWLAIPFWQNSLISTLIFSFIIFPVYDNIVVNNKYSTSRKLT